MPRLIPPASMFLQPAAFADLSSFALSAEGTGMKAQIKEGGTLQLDMANPLFYAHPRFATDLTDGLPGVALDPTAYDPAQIAPRVQPAGSGWQHSLRHMDGQPDYSVKLYSGPSDPASTPGVWNTGTTGSPFATVPTPSP